MSTLIRSLVSQARGRLLEAAALVAPGSPLVSPQGTPGATAYSYVIVAKNTAGHSTGGIVGSTATGAAALTGVNFNQLTWTAVERENAGYDVYRTAGGVTQGLIGSVAAGVVTFNDTGLAGDSADPPDENTSGVTGLFWSDDELIEHAFNGCVDLWRGFVDLHQDHFVTIDETHVDIVLGASVLHGVPDDVFRVLLIEPRDTTDAGGSRGVRFTPAAYNSPEFINDRKLGSFDPSGGGEVFYAILNAGSPVGAPTIKLSRPFASAMDIRLEYIHTLDRSDMTVADVNPIPGESDEAVIRWIVAHALGKQREDMAPDPNYLALFGMSRSSVLTVSAPRQEQTPRVVRGVFDDYDDDF